MLPGDFIAMKLSGEVNTTVSGLSEGIFWNFAQKDIASDLVKYFGLDEELLPPVISTFGMQGKVSAKAAGELGIKSGIPVTYRAGDQPNNALSLNVLAGRCSSNSRNIRCNLWGCR